MNNDEIYALIRYYAGVLSTARGTHAPYELDANEIGVIADRIGKLAARLPSAKQAEAA